MKFRIIILFAFAFVAVCLHAQNVCTSATGKNILLEDFTGIKCGNCPDGHFFVNKIKLSHPDRVFPIAVHAGYFATPTAVDQPDFRTEEGDILNDYFDIDRAGYPSGMTNRTDMGEAGLVQSRSDWTLSTRTLSYENADVNVWVGSSYDKDTRVISTNVELYYTADVAASSSALCVSLLQNRILGPQAGADMGDEYVHNHVLRAMFTPVWGDTIPTSSKGTLVTRHYEYTLPEVIGNVETDPQHLDVVAYIINQDKEVLNVNGCEVECPGMSLPLAASMEEYKILPVRNNAFPWFECYLCNEGTEDITSASFLLTIDDEDEYECQWTASEGMGLEPVNGKQQGYLRVPVEWSSSSLEHGCDYKLRLTGLNGTAYSGETIKGSFGAMLEVGGDLSVRIKTDSYADDNTFRLQDADGNLVAGYGPYAEGSATEYTETIHFPEDGIYCFEVTDAWGNGMLSPQGFIKWYDADGNLVAFNNYIKDWGYRIFFNCQRSAGINDVHCSQLSTFNSQLCNVAGQHVDKEYKGIVIKNGKKTVKK